MTLAVGPLEIEAVAAKVGDEGWTAHWTVHRKVGRRRALLGYALSPVGAAQIALGALAHDADRRALGQARLEWADLVRDLAEKVASAGHSVG